jgi:hypothetical protein
MPWNIGLPRPTLVRHGTAQYAVVFAMRGNVLVEVKPDKRHGYLFVGEPRCHVEWQSPSVAQLLDRRAEYAVWHWGLRDLAEHLRLAEFTVLPPSLPPDPWNHWDRKNRRLFKAPARKMARLPLRPVRPVALPPLMSEIEKKSAAGRAHRMA